MKKIAALVIGSILVAVTAIMCVSPTARAASGDVVKAILWDPVNGFVLGNSAHPLVASTSGGLTNNSAAPIANNVGALTSVANAAAPTWVEGNQVLESVDLSGRQRITGTTANDTTAIGNGVETHPAVARATPTAVTAGRSEKLQVSATNGGEFANIVGGAGTVVASVFTNDTTAFGNGLNVLPAVVVTAGSSLAGGRAEALMLDSGGGLAVSPVPTLNNYAIANTSISATASVSVKASSGNLYGFIANNGQATLCYLQCVNSSGAGTLGTAPIISFPLPLSTSASASLISSVPLAFFSTGIACGFSTTAGGASACGVASPATLIYK